MEERKIARSRVEEVVEEPETVVGIVNYCSNLSVREQPSSGSAIICTIPVNTEVLIEADVSGFYKVCLESGVEGYCRKDFVDVKQ